MITGINHEYGYFGSGDHRPAATGTNTMGAGGMPRSYALRMAVWGVTVLAASAGGAARSAGPAEGGRTLVVSADGQGDARTVQEAVDAVPAGNTRRVTVRIKPGVYRGRVVVPRDKPFLSFVGEDAAKTVLTFDLNAKTKRPDGREVGTFDSASVEIRADDFEAEGLTFENSTGQGVQALAVRVGGDRVAFRRCRFLGWQDTVLEDRGRHYYEDCLIAGHVDFIFGGATAFYERCEIRCLGNGYITAASTPEGTPYGFVFSDCRVTAGPGVNKVYLGRPWRPFAAVTFLRTELPAAVLPVAWHNWGEPSREKTSRYREFQSTGPGASPDARAGWSKRLSDEEAAAVTVESVLGGTDGWDPRTRRPAG